MQNKKQKDAKKCKKMQKIAKKWLRPFKKAADCGTHRRQW